MAPAAAPIIRNLDSTADDTANNQYKRFIAGMKAKDNAEERNREKQRRKDAGSDFDSSNEAEDITDSDTEQEGEDGVKDPREVKQRFDGWKLYRRCKPPPAPVRGYCNLIDLDYKRNKVTVCAHLSNIFNSFVVKKGRPTV